MTKENTSLSKIESFFKPNEKRGSLKRLATDDDSLTVTKKVVGGRRSKGKCKKEDVVEAKSAVNVHKESLILFDEIEIVFKEDTGFWATVTHFVKKSKKPIIITTNDEFVQERMNLNVERIDFERPRVDACVRFLVSVAKRETSMKLEMSTAYEIVRECGCDMRKSLVQLQALIGGDANPSVSSNQLTSSSSLIDLYKAHARNGTLDLNQALSASLFLPCPVNNHNAYFDSVFFLDAIVRRLHESQSCLSRVDVSPNSPSGFAPYDKLIVRDGLTDNGAANATSSAVVFQTCNQVNAKNTTNSGTQIQKSNL